MPNKIFLAGAMVLLGLGLFYSRRSAASVSVGPLETEWPESDPAQAIEPEQATEQYRTTYTGGLSRGERNNNPGNIEKGAAWQGLTTRPDEKRFAVFVSPDYGIRAMGIILRNYSKLYGLNTIHGIISRWAPVADNGAAITANYIKQVSARLGVHEYTPLNLNDPQQLHRLVSAIITQENGRNIYDDSLVMAGVEMSFA